MLGYFLLDSTKAHATFFLVGTGANGKSVLLNVLSELVGPDYVTHRSLEDLSTNRFATASLVGKKLNIGNEEESKRLKTDLFKNLVSGEQISAERKFGEAFSFRPRTRFVFASNHLPSFDVVDDAIRRRVFIIPFYRKISQAERDPYLVDKLLKEHSQIIAWCLEGAHRLSERKFQFVLTQSMAKSFDEFEQEQSSSIDFFEENFVLLPTLKEEVFDVSTMYSYYKNWCLDTGRKPKSQRTFMDDLRSKYDENGSRLPKKNVWNPLTSQTSRCMLGTRINKEPGCWIARHLIQTKPNV